MKSFEISQSNSDRQTPKEKTEERLQAQAEIFADETLENSQDQTKILKYSAELSKIKDLDNLPPDLPKELVDLVQKHKSAYVNFLRQEKKLETSFIEENIKTYNEKFKLAITELRAKMPQKNPLMPRKQKLPEYLGAGGMSVVFRIEVDGKMYAAKFANFGAGGTNFDIKPLLRAKGIPHTAQLAAYSFEDNVIIMGLLPGKNAGSLAPEEAPMSMYKDDKIIQLIDTVIALDAHGIAIDPNPDNFMYDSVQGFSVLDYHLKNSHLNPDELSKEIIDLRRLLTERNFELLDHKDPDYEEKARAQKVEKYKFSLPLLVHFLSILREKYPHILVDWQKRNDWYKKNPPPPMTLGNMGEGGLDVSDLVDRSDVPKSPDLEPYLQKLEEMGF